MAQLSVLMKTARSVSLLIDDGSIVNTMNEYRVMLNGKELFVTNRTVFSIYDLSPSADYCVCVKNGDADFSVSFRTDDEPLTINVRDLGAKGDGVSDDTSFIQAAIMAVPNGGRILIPEGKYLITSLFLASHIRIEIAKNAVLCADTSRENRVYFPGSIKTNDPDNDEYHLGTWEGNPLPMFAGIVTGINVEDVVIYGEGTIDGCASADNWWFEPKKMNVAYRPRMIFLNHCKDVKLQGFLLTNSPAWVMHPFFSDNLMFCDLRVINPKVSPNTDGLDPESCVNVDIVGVRFSLGDDCIAVKSGKIYMGQKYKRPSSNIHIWQCLMEDGHGAVTLGSEIAGGISDMTVEKCLFKSTDRGLRIKTRRGRGKQCFLNNIVFDNIIMDNVMNPFTANMFYFCDPDGHEEYVQSRDVYPVDERTPKLGILKFSNIKATNAHVSAGYFDGLPESKIEAVVMENVDISFAKDAKSGVPIMCDGINEMSKAGIVAKNVNRLVLKNVNIQGCNGEEVETINVDSFERD